jgi:hypothetical protein
MEPVSRNDSVDRGDAHSTRDASVSACDQPFCALCSGFHRFALGHDCLPGGGNRGSLGDAVLELGAQHLLDCASLRPMVTWSIPRAAPPRRNSLRVIQPGKSSGHPTASYGRGLLIFGTTPVSENLCTGLKPRL